MGIRSFFLFSNFFFFFYKIKFFRLFFFIYINIILIFWWRDVIRESTYLRFHTEIVKKNIYIRIVLFIISEVFFFFRFFWTFFHSSLSLAVEFRISWPPIRILTFNPIGVPFLNTIILLSSRITVTWSHYSLLLNNLKHSVFGIIFTIFLRFLFTLLQWIEYYQSFYTINDSVFRSIFYLRTRFHRLHVIIGTIFLLVRLIRLSMRHFSKYHHVRLECAIWYWHFVDVVWIFLYIVFYWWGRK